MPQLDPYGNRVVVGNVTLITPGLAGTAESFVPRRGGTRGTDMQAAEMTTAAFDTALSEEHLRPQETVEIRGTAEIQANAPTRTTGYGEPAIVAEVPDAGEDWGQVLLYTDEAGVTTWNFPVADPHRVLHCPRRCDPDLRHPPVRSRALCAGAHPGADRSGRHEGPEGTGLPAHRPGSRERRADDFACRWEQAAAAI